MSNINPIDYRDLRKAIKETERRGTFPFPSYAEALFSQVLVSRKPIKGVWEHEQRKVPLVTTGPQVSGVDPLQDNEKKEVLQSLGRFVEEQDEGVAKFKGGSIKLGEISNTLNEKDLTVGEPAKWMEPYSSELKVLFIGELPKDFSEENPSADLLSKMISAMKLPTGCHARVFLEKDAEIATFQWHEILKTLESHEEIHIVSLGAMATNIILGKKERLSKVHGKEFDILFKRKSSQVALRIYPVFHPDILQINPNMKRSAWLDLQKVMESLPV